MGLQQEILNRGGSISLDSTSSDFTVADPVTVRDGNAVQTILDAANFLIRANTDSSLASGIFVNKLQPTQVGAIGQRQRAQHRCRAGDQREAPRSR